MDMSFRCRLKIVRMGGGIIPPARNVNENVLVILSLSVMLHKATSLADLRLLEGM